jgi:hypothetical protein
MRRGAAEGSPTVASRHLPSSGRCCCTTEGDITTLVLFIKEVGDMVRVERRSGKERRSGRDRRKSSSHGHKWCGRPDSRERRSGKDRRQSPPAKA